MHAVRLQDTGSQFDTFRATLRSTFLDVEHEPRPSIGTVRAEFHPRVIGGLVSTWVKSLGEGYSSAYRDRHHISTGGFVALLH